MNTLLLSGAECQKAADIIKNGGVVAIPTETVYGLAANTFDEDAVKKIFLAKGRPSDNPLIAHISDLKSIHELVSSFPEAAQKLANKFWPGPLTMILPKKPGVPYCVTAGMESVAVRFPSHPIAREIIKKSGVPLVAPSANISGKPSPTAFEHVVHDLDGKVDAIVDGGNCSVGVESTVISFLSSIPKILRPGFITADDIKSVIGNVEVDKAVYENLKKGQKVLSPGMKYKHYSPDADVYLVVGNTADYSKYVNSKNKSDSLALSLDEDIPFLKIPYISYGSEKNINDQERNLFGALRKIDNMNIKKVYAHFSGDISKNLAVYNRLVRAAGFKIINV